MSEPLSKRIPRNKHTIIDILTTAPSSFSLEERIRQLHLRPAFEQKILQNLSSVTSKHSVGNFFTQTEEKELATEVLLERHKFTRCIFHNRQFRQAAITIIQNIYLFQNRKIFFSWEGMGPDQERQEALNLLSCGNQHTSIPLAKTFQHLIVARVWDRILATADDSFLDGSDFLHLHSVVERLNTLRNIYMILSTRLIGKLTRKIGTIYKQSITREDASQIGTFGIARAAYRYHPSMGLRFSTYAAKWILKEIQRQSLEGRLIRISSNLIEQISRVAREHTETQHQLLFDKLANATTVPLDCHSVEKIGTRQHTHNPITVLEKKELSTLLSQLLLSLPDKSRDILERRYGLGPYQGKEQSIIEISEIYNVTRSSIYQLEQSSLKKLKTTLASDLV